MLPQKMGESTMKERTIAFTSGAGIFRNSPFFFPTMYAAAAKNHRTIAHAPLKSVCIVANLASLVAWRRELTGMLHHYCALFRFQRPTIALTVLQPKKRNQGTP